MVAEALQESLSRFPKKKNIRYGAKRSIRRSHLSRYRDVIAQFKCSKPFFTVKERFRSKTVVLLWKLKQKVALDCLFYKAKTIVITKGCTTEHRAKEQRFSRKKEKTNRIGAQRMILSDLQRWLSFS